MSRLPNVVKPTNKHPYKMHGTDDVVYPTHTLCGRPLIAVQNVPRVDNVAITCGRCIAVIEARCYEHNLPRCRICPKGHRCTA